MIRNKRRNLTSLQLCRNNKELSEKIMKLLKVTNKSDALLDLTGLPVASNPSCSGHPSSSENDENNFSSTVINQRYNNKKAFVLFNLMWTEKSG